MMKSPLRLTALAVLLGLASFGAAADPLTFTFDFEDLVSEPEPGKPKVPTKYESKAIKGFTFSGGPDSTGKPIGVWAWDKDANDNGATGIGENKSGYLVNRDTSNSSEVGIFSIVLDPLEHPNLYINSVGFRYYGNGSSPVVRAFGASNQLLDQFTPAPGEWVPGFNVKPILYGLKEDNLIVRLEIEAIGDRGRTFIGVDDLTLGLFKPTTVPDGTVPEPTSFALVGLALLAAGAARRRKV